MTARRTRNLSSAIAVGLVGICALGASSAAASTATISGGTLTIADPSGANNSVIVAPSPTDPTVQVISDTAGISDPIPALCTRDSAIVIRCPTASFSSAVVSLGAGDDGFAGMSGAAANIVLDGGAGNDTLKPESGGVISVRGGIGDDQIHTPATPYASGEFTGEDGNDLLKGGLQDDTLVGDLGNDRILGAQGADTAIGGAGADALKGGPGKDKLLGQSGRDGLSGGTGKDKLRGGGGRDRGKGGPNNDSCSSIERLVGSGC